MATGGRAGAGGEEVADGPVELVRLLGERVAFSWDISPYRQIEADEANTSEVDVRFIAESPDRTRIELEHRNLDRHGSGWEGVRDGVSDQGGWPLYLDRYAELGSNCLAKLVIRPWRIGRHGCCSG